MQMAQSRFPERGAVWRQSVGGDRLRLHRLIAKKPAQQLQGRSLVSPAASRDRGQRLRRRLRGREIIIRLWSCRPFHQGASGGRGSAGAASDGQQSAAGTCWPSSGSSRRWRRYAA